MLEILAIYLAIGIVDALLFLLFLKRAGDLPESRKDKFYLAAMCLFVVVAHPYLAINELTRMYFNSSSDSDIIEAELVDDKKGKK